MSCPPSPLLFLKMVLTHLSTFPHTTRLHASVPIGGSPLDLLRYVDASVITGSSEHWHSTPESFTVLQQRGGLSSAYWLLSLASMATSDRGWLLLQGHVDSCSIIIDQDGLILFSRVIF